MKRKPSTSENVHHKLKLSSKFIISSPAIRDRILDIFKLLDNKLQFAINKINHRDSVDDKSALFFLSICEILITFIYLKNDAYQISYSFARLKRCHVDLVFVYISACAVDYILEKPHEIQLKPQ